MDSRREILWDKNEASPRQLRLPKAGLLTPNVTEEEKKKATQNEVKDDEPSTLKHSRLSADAPEWYPSQYAYPKPEEQVCSVVMSPAVSHHSVQGRLKKYKEPEQASNYYPSSSAVYESAIPPAFNNGIDISLNLNGLDEKRLRQIIQTLTNDPGQFDDLIDVFVETIIPYFEDISALSTVTKLLVKEATCNPSFRYTCARLCYYIEQGCPNFRAQLHLTCKSELDKSLNKSGVLLFVAELYTQLYHENLYGRILIDAYKQLISDGGDVNIKSVCQALKLTGYELEKYDKKGVDEVISLLQIAQNSATGTALMLITSVLNLRNAHWGHSASTSNGQSDLYAGHGEGGPNSFNPYIGGENLTPEETEFLARNINHEEFFADTSDPDDLCDPEPEMDEEIQQAFKEFIEYSKR